MGGFFVIGDGMKRIGMSSPDGSKGLMRELAFSPANFEYTYRLKLWGIAELGLEVAP